MQTRRQDPEHRKFRQDAFASSSEHERGILANLVAARCQKFSDAEEISVYWWLQQVSWRAGGLDEFASRLVDKFRNKITQMRTGGTIMDRMVAGAPDSETEAVVADGLKRALVDPASKSLRSDKYFFGTSVKFPELWPSLLKMRATETTEAGASIVETEITRTIDAELDFALESRSFILIEGREGIGKSEAAKRWCAAHPGRAIYVRLESGTDESTLFRSIARVVGTACAYTRKAVDMRARIQDALQPGHIMLVLDEAHFLWPQAERCARSAPKRVDWLRTALIDFGVPVALVSTPQFFARSCEKHMKGGWNANQVQRRLTNTVLLPELISAAEMKAVAKRYFPNASGSDLTRIALTSARELGFLTVIVHLRKRVDFLAKRCPGKSESEYLDEALKVYAAAPAVQPPCKGSAAPLQAPSRAIAQTPSRGTTPAAISRIHHEQSALTVT